MYPNDWYWVVANDATQVYSSKRGGFFPVNDAEYRTWAATFTASRVVSLAELGEVLASVNLRPVNAELLDAFKEGLASRMTVEAAMRVIFNHENRIRALEGRQPIDAQQFRTAIKALL